MGKMHLQPEPAALLIGCSMRAGDDSNASAKLRTGRRFQIHLNSESLTGTDARLKLLAFSNQQQPSESERSAHHARQTVGLALLMHQTGGGHGETPLLQVLRTQKEALKQCTPILLIRVYVFVFEKKFGGHRKRYTGRNFAVFR